MLTPNCLEQILQALRLSLASTNTLPSPFNFRCKVPLFALTAPPDSWADNQTPQHPFSAVNYTPLVLLSRLPVFGPLTWSGFYSSTSTIGPLASNRPPISSLALCYLFNYLGHILQVLRLWYLLSINFSISASLAIYILRSLSLMPGNLYTIFFLLYSLIIPNINFLLLISLHYFSISLSCLPSVSFLLTKQPQKNSTPESSGQSDISLLTFFAWAFSYLRLLGHSTFD